MGAARAVGVAVAERRSGRGRPPGGPSAVSREADALAGVQPDGTRTFVKEFEPI